jgi:OFA family oxalate/formate antiporter-like MFS transporter
MNERNKGWSVTLAGLGLNLALGVLYAWSMFSKQLTEAVDAGGFGWSRTTATLPYTCAIAFFAVMMIPAGRFQDRLGPRVVASVGAILCGLGLMVASFGSATSTWPVVLGFGVMAGTGIGLGYAAATPAAVKWFGPEKKGLITGIVVAGFGLAPVYIAPLSRYLLTTYGISRSFLIFGGVFLVVASIAAQFMVNPPSKGASPSVPVSGSSSAVKPAGSDRTWGEMLRTPTFWTLYLQYACGATAGLMIIGHMAKIVSVQSNGAIQAGFLFVAVLAVFNAAGRVIAGVASDLIGRVAAMIIVFVLQATTLFFFAQFTSVTAFLFGAALVGFNYGACLSLFPATAADYWGTRNLGLNYGILFTAWGVGGVFGPILAGTIADSTGSYAAAYHVASGLLIFAAVLAVVSHFVRRSSARQGSAPAMASAAVEPPVR